MYKMPVKRVLFQDNPYKRPSKIPRTVATKLNRLSRAVAAQKPEIREDTYFITVNAARTAPVDLLVSASMESLDPGSSQIRLHSIRLAYVHTVGDALWQLLWTPKGTASSVASLFNTTNSFDVANYLSTPDSTQATVYKMLNFTGKIQAELANQIISFEQRFAIPKIIRFDNEKLASGNPIDQFHYAGGCRSAGAARTLCVTVQYTCT